MNALSPISQRPHLTSAERVETLVDAITTYQVLLNAANRYGDLVNGDGGLPTDTELDALDRMYDASDTAAQVVCHVARTLMAEGLLERCADMLRATTDSQT